MLTQKKTISKECSFFFKSVSYLVKYINFNASDAKIVRTRKHIRDF